MSLNQFSFYSPFSDEAPLRRNQQLLIVVVVVVQLLVQGNWLVAVRLFFDYGGCCRLITGIACEGWLGGAGPKGVEEEEEHDVDVGGQDGQKRQPEDGEQVHKCVDALAGEALLKIR